MSAENLHIPQEINYECTGCGTCCSGWAVHLTADDYERIAAVDWAESHADYKGQVLFKELKKYEQLNTPYSHKIVSDDGSCPFLVNKLCFIHSQKNAEFKPSICQLFPYCFTDTPSGTYATISFVSMGAIYNSGRALSEQRGVLEQKLAEFRLLFPQYKPDWSKIFLAAEVPIDWDEYLIHEAALVEKLQDFKLPLEERLQNCCDYLSSELEKKPRRNAGRKPAEPERSSNLNAIDKHLLATFHKMYYPTKPQKSKEKNFGTTAFWLGVIFKGNTLFEFPNSVYALDQLREFPFPENDKEIEDMLYRYAFSHIFGKKYFGAGFGHLTLITGFHHLILVLCLAKLHARGIARNRKAPVVSLIDVVAALKQLETQLGETIIGTGSASTYELLLQYPSRARRFLANS